MLREVIEEKRFEIISLPISLGRDGEIPGCSWVEETAWISEDHCQELLKKVQKRYEEMPHYSQPKEPQIITYWRTISVKELD